MKTAVNFLVPMIIYSVVLWYHDLLLYKGMKELKVVLDVNMIKMLTGVHPWLCQAGGVVQLEISLCMTFKKIYIYFVFSLLLLGYLYLFHSCWLSLTTIFLKLTQETFMCHHTEEVTYHILHITTVTNKILLSVNHLLNHWNIATVLWCNLK